MRESGKLEYKLTVEAKDANGNLKEVRYITKNTEGSVEFVPNKLYMYLLKSGKIKGDTYKIPFLLGTRKKEK